MTKKTIKPAKKINLYVINSGDAVEFATFDLTEAIASYKYKLTTDIFGYKMDIVKIPNGWNFDLQFGELYILDEDGETVSPEDPKSLKICYYKSEKLAEYLDGFSFVDAGEIEGAITDFFENLGDVTYMSDLAIYSELAANYEEATNYFKGFCMGKKPQFLPL